MSNNAKTLREQIKATRLQSSEWRAFLSALRRGDADSIITELAAAAMVPSNDLPMFKMAVAGIGEARREAKLLPALAKERCALENKLAGLVAAHRRAASNADRESLGAEAEAVEAELRKGQPAFLSATLAEQRRAAWLAEGIE